MTNHDAHSDRRSMPGWLAASPVLDPPEGSGRADDAAPARVSRRKFLRASGSTVGATALFPLLGAGRGAVAGASESRVATPKMDPDELFMLGLFEEADRGYRRLLRDNPQDAHAAARRGYIALLSNKFEAAETYLTRAVELAPDDEFSKLQLADTFVRQDQLALAVPLLRTLDERSRAQAETYATITGTPYQVAGAESTLVPFPALDPLPHFQISVNGRDSEYFLFDTGANLNFTKETAERAGLRAVARSTAFAAGQQLTLSHGVVDSLRIGEIELRNVPVTWPDEFFVPNLPDGTLPAGVVGTDIFYRFLTTLDYANQQLVLRWKTSTQLRSFRAEARRAGAEVLPLWLVTDHLGEAPFPLRLACTLGSLNEYGPRVVVLDTGGIGIGLVTTKQFAELAGIEIDFANPIPAGPFTLYPFIADKISLGDAVRRDVPGLIGPPIQDQFNFEVIGGFAHEFYRPFAVTFDFVDMNLYITGDLQ
jgi:Aspartyl protease